MANITTFGERTYLFNQTESLSDDTQKLIRYVLEQNQAVGVAGGLYDETLTLTFVSQAFLDIVGHTAQSLEAASKGQFIELVDERDRDYVRSDTFRAARSQRYYRIKHRNGTPVTVTEFRTDMTADDSRPGWIISLRRSEDEIVSAAPVSWSLDLMGDRRIQWSERLLNFCASQRNAMVDNPDAWLELVHPDDRLRVTDVWKRLTKGQIDGNLVSDEYRIKNPAGDWVWVNSQTRIFRNEAGDPLKISGFATVIERARSLKDRLQETSAERHRYRDFHDAITRINLCEFCVDLDNDEYFAFKADGPLHFLFAANPSWSAFTQAFVSQCVLPESASETRHFYELSFMEETLRAAPHEATVTSRVVLGGRTRWVSQTAVAVHPSEKGLGKIILFLRDVTTDVNARRRETELHHDLEDTLGGADIGIYTIEHENGKPSRMYADRTMRRLVEAPENSTPEAVYSAWADHVAPEAAPDVKKAYEALATTGRFEITYPWLSKLGPIYVRCGGTTDPTFKNGLRYKGYHQIVTDFVEAEQRSRAALREACKAANSANAAKTDFLARMSHDIRTPLNGILGMATIARSHITDPTRVNDALDKISAAGQHLAMLLNEVLSLTKIESGKDEADMAPLDLSQLLKNIGDTLSPTIAAASQTFTLDLSGVRHPFVVSDAVKLRRIITNLIDNASKYTPKGGDIRVKAGESFANAETGTYEISVEDNGIGMSREYLEHIFEPFSRAKEVDKTIEGTGLGLAITSNLVHQLGGTVSVESELGKGTKFTLTFDLLHDDQIPPLAAPTPATDSAPDDGNRSPVVLVVDDNDLNREIAAEFVRMAGAVPVCASSGEEAIQIFSDSEPGFFHLILLDIQMPGLSGYDTARAIRALDRPDAGLPITALSANAYAEDVAAARRAGMNDYLAKPVDPAKVARVIHQFTKNTPLT